MRATRLVWPRGFILVLGAALVLPLVTSLSAQPDTHITMPYTCHWEGSRPVLTPGPTTSHAITGQRSQKPYTVCFRMGARDCVSMNVHAFDVQCSGRPVPWYVLARQIQGFRSGDSWINGSVLHFVRADQRVAVATTDAARRDVKGFALPQGFAPIDALGVRLASQPSLRQRTALNGDEASASRAVAVYAPGPASPESWSTVVSALPLDIAEPTVAPSVRPTPVVEASHDIQPASMMAEMLIGVTALLAIMAALLTWKLAGNSGSLSAGMAGSVPRWMRSGLAQKLGVRLWSDRLSGLMSGGLNQGDRDARFSARFQKAKGIWRSLSSVVSWVVKGPNFPDDGQVSGLGGRSEAAALAGGLKAVERVMDKTQDAVDRLNPRSPLCETLQGEIKTVRQRFNVTHFMAQDEDHDPASRARRRAVMMRAAIRDLERIQKIARSAASGDYGSPATGKSSSNPLLDETGALAMPETFAEAYRVLGVTSSVDDRALKKVVDALRMSWHPDLSVDETDRLVREERIKQINLAWDLIKSHHTHQGQRSERASEHNTDVVQPAA
ncbi:MAG: J domain-containing protein [Pseudomonadota bacterium]